MVLQIKLALHFKRSFSVVNSSRIMFIHYNRFSIHVPTFNVEFYANRFIGIHAFFHLLSLVLIHHMVDTRSFGHYNQPKSSTRAIISTMVYITYFAESSWSYDLTEMKKCTSIQIETKFNQTQKQVLNLIISTISNRTIIS